jgi:hypothetical protein
VAVITEVAAGFYRINAELPGKPVTVSMFVIYDEVPTLAENVKGGDTAPFESRRLHATSRT